MDCDASTAGEARSFLLKTRASENELVLDVLCFEELSAVDDDDGAAADEEVVVPGWDFLDGGSLSPYTSAMSATGVGKVV